MKKMRAMLCNRLLKNYGETGTRLTVQKASRILFTIAYHQMIDHIRKVKRISLKENFNDEAKVYDKPAHNLKKVLEEALAKLNETQRSLVLLKDYEGYSYEEIGANNRIK